MCSFKGYLEGLKQVTASFLFCFTSVLRPAFICFLPVLGKLSLANNGGVLSLCSCKNLVVKTLNLYKSKTGHFNKVPKGLEKPTDTKKLKEFKRKIMKRAELWLHEVELRVWRSLCRPEGDNPGRGLEACGVVIIFSCRMAFHV